MQTGLTDAPSKQKDPTETRLTGLSHEEVKALPPEQYGVWKRQVDEEERDFTFFLHFVQDLYPSVRRHFKRSRAEDFLGDFSKPSETPLFEAFERLLTLADAFRLDPDLAGRLRHQLRCSGAPLVPDGVPGEEARKEAVRPEAGERPDANDCPAPDSVCPDCGSGLDINSPRCPVCRRFIE